ncbi:long-chain fatty acid--CoA ligase [Notoacmeibacter marinus]|uniref:Long-chain-fatty-acid--CoA ligase n=1 Tax=Notoacmeibacter marinus TaxID=1876515 RepID=A0A231V0J8_9HYPH|nr:long-chain-fatty-acid--CoA ligase [Notoacmeibacter marinus]OXT01735.1 long-chain fatty acid--CoA ligase [Notoacmeibacter marinus]
MTDKPWLTHYPDTVPAEIEPLRYRSLGELLYQSCKKWGDRPAFTCLGTTITFSEIARQAEALAAYLQSLGLEKGARVAVMMPNVLQYPIAVTAILRAGYTVVGVNPLYTPRELEHQLNDSGAEAIVILENFAASLEKIKGKTGVKHVILATMGDLLGVKGYVVNFVVRRVKKMVPSYSLDSFIRFNDAVSSGKDKTFTDPGTGPEDIAFLQYTGGTTGVSKGAILLHRNILANMEQNRIWVAAAFPEGREPGTMMVCPLPLYHIYALTVNLLNGIEEGQHNLLIPNPRDIPAFVKALKGQPFQAFVGLNTLFVALMNNKDFRELDFSNLKLTLGGGMSVQRPVAERWEELTGVTIHEGYGLSETSPVATSNPLDAKEFSGTIGVPLPSTDVKLLSDDGQEVAQGEVGEIAIFGPQVMAGYWNRPDETANVMTDDGYFRTGDMAFMDERGYFKIVDRKKDMILVSGFNVYPNEIEEVVAGHPDILEAAAIGVPDEKSGEVPKLFVVRKEGSTIDETEILKYCRENLTGYKRPRKIEFRDELPKSPVGKILRKDLRPD